MANASARRATAPTPVEPTEPYAPKIGRIPVRLVQPAMPEHLYPPKAFENEVVPFSAVVFREGHDLIGADLVLTTPSGVEWRHAMTPGPKGTDLFSTRAKVHTPGRWSFVVEAYADDWGTWLHNAEIKIAAGQDIELVFADAVKLLKRAGKATAVKAAQKRFADTTLTPEERLATATDPALVAAIAKRPIRSLVTGSEPRTLRVERARAGVGSWYEFFPRSIGAERQPDGSWRSGTFRTAAERLPEVAAMGFDVLYLPPIHPIGRAFRKGPNNTLNAGPNDPGSPWAIGAAEGGHDAIHPDLGTMDDFRWFLARAKENGIEVALDLAFQASPDHPWVTEHPEWFAKRPDGSIAYAENPPKKYQDIYPLNFDDDPVGIREELLRIVRFWIEAGVTIFRVDNPHTKPLQFWEWLLDIVYRERPDVVFLSEAFTKPAMMQGLAQVGFQQSYTYFTWRNTKQELEEYLTEVSTETSSWLRPNFFVNTQDILTPYLQFGGRPAYKIRAAIAATASPSWGVYSGYELIENVARPGSEENIDNEKYEFKPRDFAGAEERGESLAPYLTALNRIRREHPALHQLRNLSVHWSSDDAILVYSKHLPAAYSPTGADDTIIVVANLDPHSVREATVYLDPTAFGVDPAQPFEVTDLITGQSFTWGLSNYVRLDAFTEPVHIVRVEHGKGRA